MSNSIELTTVTGTVGLSSYIFIFRELKKNLEEINAFRYVSAVVIEEGTLLLTSKMFKF